MALVVSVLLKLIASPLLAYIGCRLFGLDPLATSVAVLFAALPPAPSAFILAKTAEGVPAGAIAAMLNLPVADVARSLSVLRLHATEAAATAAPD